MLDMVGLVTAGRQKHLECDIFHAACLSVFDETLVLLRYNCLAQVLENSR